MSAPVQKTRGEDRLTPAPSELPSARRRGISLPIAEIERDSGGRRSAGLRSAGAGPSNGRSTLPLPSVGRVRRGRPRARILTTGAQIGTPTRCPCSIPAILSYRGAPEGRGRCAEDGACVGSDVQWGDRLP